MRNSPPSSTRYWPSPARHLGLRRSRLGLLLQLALLLALAAALSLICRDGYPALAGMVALPALLCLYRRPGSRPRALTWRNGCWYFLLPGSGWCVVELLPPVHCLPWLVYLRWRRPGQRGAQVLCLWPDSAGAPDQRWLRKRLRLDQGQC